MLKIGKLTDYGVVVLNELAKAGGVKLSTEDIACQTGLTLPTVRKVMKALVDSGLVIAQRGAKGGYRIARAPGQIRILDIVQAFEGPVAVTECATDDASCDITDSCSLASNWGGINQLITQVLSRVTLADIREPERQLKLVKETLPMTSMIDLVNLS
ncbi:MAG: SUF system Fe-S cluster assembly regulator [Oceanospirillaceae bacterium]|uniref:SUF system Fe-S cluster assembly regulator n=1 Tax=unclassified Thalassolituus TaxID=2624967 RepID=UPI000C0B479E|nr:MULTISPECIES: SUF system Fe-S cluster assembly regulator [unclassified Thalassolituus]MAK90978.1 SUF system Fe-S cluster assembly regulator [Thalassolituus sp.]MAY00592.1 SUF system Fe-S cluster assembly regulator [Oceanospirillaceae bacterium]MBL35282.1 SUF system Fe-S cluster assembly regulator [Oceanospirillaceae bacterium]MBS54621.1 SUF system Fe-S cluster assembly regulator [Oceanospirillaceae bacterium]|tara:strand:- start:1269 stop:1739 length:471 start_codon:yes stop_codon:yes gene_type:complete